MKPIPSSPSSQVNRSSAQRASRLKVAQDLAIDGVVTRQMLYGAGITRGEVRAHLRAERWQTVWNRSIAVHTGPLHTMQRLRAAVNEGGPHAMLDGVSSLIASGMTGFESSTIRGLGSRARARSASAGIGRTPHPALVPR